MYNCIRNIPDLHTPDRISLEWDALTVDFPKVKDEDLLFTDPTEVPKLDELETLISTKVAYIDEKLIDEDGEILEQFYQLRASALNFVDYYSHLTDIPFFELAKSSNRNTTLGIALSKLEKAKGNLLFALEVFKGHAELLANPVMYTPENFNILSDQLIDINKSFKDYTAVLHEACENSTIEDYGNAIREVQTLTNNFDQEKEDIDNLYKALEKFKQFTDEMEFHFTLGKNASLFNEAFALLQSSMDIFHDLRGTYADMDPQYTSFFTDYAADRIKRAEAKLDGIEKTLIKTDSMTFSDVAFENAEQFIKLTKSLLRIYSGYYFSIPLSLHGKLGVKLVEPTKKPLPEPENINYKPNYVEEPYEIPSPRDAKIIFSRGNVDDSFWAM